MSICAVEKWSGCWGVGVCACVVVEAGTIGVGCEGGGQSDDAREGVRSGASGKEAGDRSRRKVEFDRNSYKSVTPSAVP